MTETGNISRLGYLGDASTNSLPVDGGVNRGRLAEPTEEPLLREKDKSRAEDITRW